MSIGRQEINLDDEDGEQDSIPASLLDVARKASTDAREAGLKGDDQLRAIVAAVLAAVKAGGAR